MRSSWIHATSLGLILWLFASLSASVLAEPQTHAATGIVFPDALGDFGRTRVTDYEKDHPGLGFSYTYSNGTGVVATVYVYTAGYPTVPSDLNDPTMRTIREQTIREVQKAARTRGDTVRQLLDGPIGMKTASGEVVDIFFDRFLMTLSGRSTVSDVWHLPTRGHVLKIRITRPLQGTLKKEQGYFDFSPAEKESFEFVIAVVNLSR